MTIQVDYVFAVSAFIITFTLLIYFTTDYYTKTDELTELMVLRSNALSLLSTAECSYDNCLQSPAFRFYILVNNTQENLINQSHTISDLTDELVIFNLYDIYPDPDINSVAVYQDSTKVNYQRSGDEITFKTDIDANQAKFFTVYFDDDSNFTDRSVSVNGGNNLTEKIYPIETFHLLQYRKLDQLNNSGMEFESEFHITIYDEANQTFIDYGTAVPTRGNVVALQKHVAYQDPVGDIEFGRFLVQVW